MSRTRSSKFRTLARTLVQTTAVLAVAGCISNQSPNRAAVEIKGSDPAASAPPAPPPAASAPTPPAATATTPAAPAATAGTVPDARGIVAYDGYQAAVARSGDTVARVARRIGLSAS